MSDTTIEFVESSGNVFADLGLSNPDERMAKAELALAITRHIRARGLNQTEAALTAANQSGAGIRNHARAADELQL